MRYRKLRIAWSVVWGVLAVLSSYSRLGFAERRHVPHGDIEAED